MFGIGSPSLTLAGAYFPAWIFWALGGSVAALGARAVFVATGLASVLPFQLLVCLAIGVMVGLLGWSLEIGG